MWFNNWFVATGVPKKPPPPYGGGSNQTQNPRFLNNFPRVDCLELSFRVQDTQSSWRAPYPPLYRKPDNPPAQVKTQTLTKRAGSKVAVGGTFLRALTNAAVG